MIFLGKKFLEKPIFGKSTGGVGGGGVKLTSSTLLGLML